MICLSLYDLHIMKANYIAILLSQQYLWQWTMCYFVLDCSNTFSWLCLVKVFYHKFIRLDFRFYFLNTYCQFTCWIKGDKVIITHLMNQTFIFLRNKRHDFPFTLPTYLYFQLRLDSMLVLKEGIIFMVFFIFYTTNLILI